MLTIEPFGWRRLSPLATLSYRLDATGALLLQGADPTAPPLTAARVRDGHGGFTSRGLDAMGLVWSPAVDGDGWVLRTRGQPTTMASLAARWFDLVAAASAAANVDERILLTTIACETGNAAPDGDGYVKAPRTERGYPSRTGETDPGDFDRDAIDWTLSKGAHSSHGLCQTLIATAYRVRPDLFAGVSPDLYRTVLWNPGNSIACGAAYLAGFTADQLADPIAARVVYASGAVRPESNPWGARVYDDMIVLLLVARWNDDAALRSGAASVDVPLPVSGSGESTSRLSGEQVAWVTAGLACFGLSLVAGLYALHYRRAAAVPA